MTLEVFVSKLKECYTAAREAKWTKSLTIGFELAVICIQSWSGPPLRLASGQTIDQICANLEATADMKMATADGSVGAMAQIVWPMLKALLIKILQQL